MQQHSPEPGTIDLEAVAHRIRQMLGDLNISGMTFCSATGVPYSTLRTYTSGARAPSAEFLAAAFRTYGVMPSWLLTGEGAMGSVSGARDASEFVIIPILPIQISAGPGTANPPDADFESSGMCLSREWLSRRNLNPRSLRVVQVRGASMDSVLSHGDLVLLDQSDDTPRSGFIYVLRLGDELLVKYIELRPGGVLRVSSANASFEPYDVDLAKTPDVSVVGRVVASMHEW